MIEHVFFSPGVGSGESPRAVVSEWLAKEGERVAAGQPLCSYEIDKAVDVFVSPGPGWLRRHCTAVGERLAGGDLVALLSDTPDEPLPDREAAPRADDEAFDWTEIDNRSGPAEPLGLMRRVIADRMTMARRHIPCFYLTVAVDMTGCLALRGELRKSGGKATFNDMTIRAAALALVEFPKVAAVYVPDGVIPRDNLHIGFAAALPDDGLVVPVVKHADRKSLLDISADTRRLAAKAKSGELKPDDCRGGVFSVSYLGSYEVDSFVAIVNPGEAAIIAVGKTIDTPVAVNGSVEIRPMAKITMSSDHRSIDGALAARFMGEVKRLLEKPERL